MTPVTTVTEDQVVVEILDSPFAQAGKVSVFERQRRTHEGLVSEIAETGFGPMVFVWDCAIPAMCVPKPATATKIMARGIVARTTSPRTDRT